MEHKYDEGERFDWLKRPLPSDALHYAAAEAKTILQLYHQVRKENKDPDTPLANQSKVNTPLPGPTTPYKAQQAERRRVLTAGLSGQQRSLPVQPLPAPPLASVALQSSPVKKSKKTKSWMSTCLGASV